MRDGSIVPFAMRDAFKAMRRSIGPYFLPYLGLAIVSSGLLNADHVLQGHTSRLFDGEVFCAGVFATLFFEAATSALYLREMHEGKQPSLGEFRNALQTSGLGRVVTQLLGRLLLWTVVAAVIALVGILLMMFGLALFHSHGYLGKGQKHPWIAKVWSRTMIVLLEVFWSRYWFVLPSFMRNGRKPDLFQEPVQRARSFRLAFCLVAVCVALVAMTPYQLLRPWLIPLLGQTIASRSMRLVSHFVGALVETWLLLFRAACYLRSTPPGPEGSRVRA